MLLQWFRSKRSEGYRALLPDGREQHLQKTSDGTYMATIPYFSKGHKRPIDSMLEVESKLLLDIGKA